MGVPCMPVRVLCNVMSTDLHGALGFGEPGHIPLTPSDMTLWFAYSTTYYGFGDAPVSSVLICGEKAVNRGADTKYFRLHITVTGLVPPNVVVFPPVDQGLFTLVIAFGATKPVWGPTTVKAGGKSLAVIAIPYSPVAPCNQLVCTDPFDMPMGHAIQASSNVFAGMSLADYLLCMVSIAVDMLLSFLINLLFGGLEGMGKFFAKGLFEKILKRLGPKLAVALGKGLSAIVDKIVERMTKHVPEPIARLILKPIEEGFKKLVGAGAGGLSPDDLLGFGNDPPIWAR